MEKVKVKRRRRIERYVLLGLFLLIAGDLLLVRFWRRIPIAPDTTRITGPFTRDGTPDYVAAMNAQWGRGVTPENNAAPLLLAIVGTEPGAREWLPEDWRHTILEPLGLPAEPSAPLCVDYADELLRQAPAATEPGDDSLLWEDYETHARPWTEAASPRRAEWLKRQRPALERLHVALMRPRFYMPWVPPAGKSQSGDMVQTMPPWTSRFRTLGRLLQADAMRCIGEKDVQGFGRDAADLMRLSRLLDQGPTFYWFLTGSGLERSAAAAYTTAAREPGFLDESQAKRLLAQLQGFEPSPGPAKYFDIAERYESLDRLCDAAAHGWDVAASHGIGRQPVSEGAGFLRAIAPSHYARHMRQVNLYYDRIVIALHLPSYVERRRAVDELDAAWDRDRAQERWRVAIDPSVILIIFHTQAGSSVKFHQEARVRRDMAEVVLALRAYRAARGEFPDSLAPLAPAILKEIPADGFADTPLHYRREGRGYLLYSVGPDLRDDAGRDPLADLSREQFSQAPGGDESPPIRDPAAHPPEGEDIAVRVKE